MPSRSKAQHNLMEAVAHNPKFAKRVGINPNVAREYVNADKTNDQYKQQDHVAKSKTK